jgi:multidrug resistance efflux pump
MDMYTDDLISREELRSKMGALNADIDKAENELKLIAHNLDKGSQLEELLSRTFKTIEDVVLMDTLTNAQLKQAIQKIIVNHDGNCDIYLRLFGDMGFDDRLLVADN